MHLMDAPGHGLPPHPITHLNACQNWDHNKHVAMAYINLSIAKTKLEHCEGKTTAKTCWDALQDFHLNEGPIKQINLIQKALSMSTPYSKLIVQTARDICDNICHAFQMPGGVTEETFICIALLNSLGFALNHSHTHTIIQ